jgi:DNA-binding NtrC family response regulator
MNQNMTDKIKILLIEDDAVDQMAFKRFVSDGQLPYECSIASSVSEAKRILNAGFFDVIISDYMLGDGTAFDILKLDIETPVIIITGAGSEEVAVRAMKAGAYDYIIKDLEHNYLKVFPLTVEKSIKNKKAEERCKILSDKESEDVVIAGSGGCLKEILNLVELAKSTDTPVLITGETGTGKNLIAKAIHYKSRLNAAPFISINCASLPENLIEAELFGYKRGAFTGAVTNKKGILEMADGGSILLDEIGEMPLHLQAKLLSAIEDKKIRRLGGESLRPINARIIAATGVDLEEALGKTFRKDLYYRLSVIRIHIPPLRERQSDIPELCDYLIKKITEGRDVGLSGQEIEKLMAYDWPGNVRELKNILERAIILQKDTELRPSELLVKKQTAPLLNNISGIPVMTLEEVEKNHIKSAFSRFSGNITKTSGALGISISTLKRKIKAYGLK